jgi:UrcA family protein
MTPNIPALRHSCVALAAVGALVGAVVTPISSAAAQTTYQTTQTTYPNGQTYTTTEQMTIIAPYVHHRTIGRSYTGAPVEELSLSRVVDYSDLDLSRWTDVQVLDDRVRQAAYAACYRLDREYPESLYPSYQSSDRDCVARATNEGMAQARFVVAQANGYPPFAR